MTRFVVAALAAGFAALLASPTAQAQTAPNRPATQAEAARTQRQQQMTPEEAERDRQLQLMEARTGNTSISLDRSPSVAGQGENTGSFKVRKYKSLPGQEEQRGTTRRVLLGARTTGKPLVHNKKHKFLFF